MPVELPVPVTEGLPDSEGEAVRLEDAPADSDAVSVSVEDAVEVGLTVLLVVCSAKQRGTEDGCGTQGTSARHDGETAW